MVTLTCDILCLCKWLQLAVHHHAAAGQPITNFLARPLQLSTKQYVEKGMTCSNAWARVNQVLESTGHVHKSKCAQHDSQAATNACHRARDISAAAVCNGKIVKYYTDLHMPTRFRQDT